MATIVAAAGLAGCHPEGVASSGDITVTGGKYCTPFPSTTATAANSAPGLAPPAVSDPAAAFDDCVHRWGYVLARSHDPADVVAQASVEACSSILSNWSQQIGQSQQGYSDPYGARRGRQTAQTPDPEAQRMHAAEGQALFYVVQARASGCAAPPANTLVTPTVPAS